MCYAVGMTILKSNPTMSGHQIVINIPENVVIPEWIENDQPLLRNAIALVLYKKGKLTMREAREIMGVSRREFEDSLGEFGFSMMDEHDLENELKAAQRISS
jgi:predicted HTH domain antitoxin